MTEREISTDTYNDVIKAVFVTSYAAFTANTGADKYLGMLTSSKRRIRYEFRHVEFDSTAQACTGSIE